jgi:hypothetical protein
MKAVFSSETSGTSYPQTRRNNPEDLLLQQQQQQQQQQCGVCLKSLFRIVKNTCISLRLFCLPHSLFCRGKTDFLRSNETIKVFIILGGQSSLIHNNIISKNKVKWKYCSILNTGTVSCKIRAVLKARCVYSKIYITHWQCGISFQMTKIYTVRILHLIYPFCM